MRIGNFVAVVVCVICLLGCAGQRAALDGAGAPAGLAAKLPGLPAVHSAAGVLETSVDGSAVFDKSASAVVNAPVLELSAAAGELCWGIWELPAVDELRYLDVSLSIAEGQEAYLALADYSRGTWELTGPVDAGRVLELDPARHSSPANTMYVLVLVHDGHSATVNGLQLIVSHANSAPIAALEADPLSGDAPLQVTFDASASSDPDQNDLIVRYYWDFEGDGEIDSITFDPTVAHMYSSAGLFNATVFAEDAASERSSASVEISVNVTGNAAPLADLQADASAGDAPLAVSFDATLSSDAEGPLARYDFDFDGDMQWDSYDAPPQVEHVYTIPGLYSARVRVTDSAGAQDTASVDINVSTAGNNPPSAVLTPASYSGTGPLAVEFDASGSDAGGDPGDSIVQYDWDWDGDGSFDAFSTNPTISHTYGSSGSYTATLRVTDTAGNQAADTSSISVNAAPRASFTATPPSGVPGETVLLNASGSTDENGSIAQYEWDLDGNGSFETDTGTNNYTLKVLPGTPGHYAVGLRVTDDDGATDSTSLTLAAEGWANANPHPDSAGTTGLYTSLAVVNGKPAISYYDNSNENLRYVQASDTDGSAWTTPVTVDITGGVGLYTSLAVVNGRPAISYYDDLNDDLRYVRASNADGSAWAAPATVDSAGTTGEYSSLAVVNGKPAISYLDGANGDLRYVQANDADGSTWAAPLTLDSAGISGAFCSLAVVNGKPAISYSDITNGDLHYIRASDADGSAWAAPVTPDSTGDTGWYSSLAVVNGKPAISYCYNSTGLLRYVQASDADGSAWATPVDVDSSGTTGYFPSLAEVNGKPAISYWHGATSDLRYVQATNADGSSWAAPVTLDSAGDTGWYTSLAVVNGQPAISYWDSSNGDLRYIKLY